MQQFFAWITGPIWHMLFYRARTARQATLLWTLAVAVEKQVVLVPFLEALADEAGGRWRWKLRGLASLLHAGTSIPNALEAVSGILPADTVLLIRVGAETGRLGPALREAATQFTLRSEAVRYPIGAGFAYLAIVFMAMLFVLTFLMIWIVPKFRSIFDGFDVELPELTQSMIRVSNFGVSYSLLLFPLAIVLFVVVGTLGFEVLGWGSGMTGGTRWLARLSTRLKTPLVLRCLSLAVDGDRPLAIAFSTIMKRHPDRWLRSRLARVEEEVLAGQDCWCSLASARLLRRGESSLLAAAQRVGNLGWALRDMAEAIERRSEYRSRIIADLLRPVALLGTGAVVGFFVIGMFLPLVKLITMLS
ncbi:MAG: hypothetical protein EXS05_05995 [Planctomycetaceae bacterium]|nr:hypothetical protein [Planctomycetaceae bacterium]